MLELLPRKINQACSSTSSLRQSAVNIAAKMESHLQNDACSSTISLCYKSFDEFKSRIYQLKLSPSWNIAITADNIVKITCSEDIHIVPLFEIFCEESLSFSIRVLLWKLPSTHEIHTNYSGSYKNIATCSSSIALETKEKRSFKKKRRIYLSQPN